MELSFTDRLISDYSQRRVFNLLLRGSIDPVLVASRLPAYWILSLEKESSRTFHAHVIQVLAMCALEVTFGKA